MIPVLVNVAFFTLLERKILGLAQSRKGPNKVAVAGIFQPFADAVKLFMKEAVKPVESSWFFILAPASALVVSLMMWKFLPFTSFNPLGEFSALLLLVLLSLSLYPLLFAGWASNSKYALVGAIRGVAQTLSYEISLAFIFFSFFCVSCGLNLEDTVSSASKTAMAILGGPLYLMWLISCVAETNRTPFDFAEGESELVSGFNIEFGAGMFALIFMAEYASIMFFSSLTVALLGVQRMSSLIVLTLIFCFIWVWMRATLPRFRYDMLMNMAWKSMLPLAISLAWLFFWMNIV